MEKGILSVVGKDRIGIIAKVCSYLASENLNILDITQTITGGYFNMMVIVSLEKAKDIKLINDDLKKIGEELSVSIKLQHEDFFLEMHRI